MIYLEKKMQHYLKLHMPLVPGLIYLIILPLKEGGCGIKRQSLVPGRDLHIRSTSARSPFEIYRGPIFAIKSNYALEANLAREFALTATRDSASS